MQQTRFNELLEVPYAEFDRRVREARQRAAAAEAAREQVADAETHAERIEALA